MSTLPDIASAPDAPVQHEHVGKPGSPETTVGIRLTRWEEPSVEEADLPRSRKELRKRQPQAKATKPSRLSAVATDKPARGTKRSRSIAAEIYSMMRVEQAKPEKDESGGVKKIVRSSGSYD